MADFIELIDTVIDYLKNSCGIKIQKIADRLGIQRIEIYTKRRSVKKKVRDEFAREIIGAFPEYFPNGELPENLMPPTMPTIAEVHEDKYVKLLEETLKEQKAENAQMKKEMNDLRLLLQEENKLLIKEIRELISRINLSPTTRNNDG